MRTILPNEAALDRKDRQNFSLYSPMFCCVCGRKCHNSENWLLLTREETGLCEYAISHPLDATEKERDLALWVAPIGSDCLRKHPELKHAVIGTTGDL